LCLSVGTRFHNYGDVFRDGDRYPISDRRYLATETQRHREEHASSGAPDVAPRSGGRGVPPANERPVDSGSVVRLRVARLTARPAVQADRVELSVSQCLCGLSNQYVGVITK
jgi:hypothetical protein